MRYMDGNLALHGNYLFTTTPLYVSGLLRLYM